MTSDITLPKAYEFREVEARCYEYWLDPLPEIGRICKEENVWLHVDGAMSGTAAVCPEFRYIQEGIEFADSYAFNPHKWMFTNFDCDCFFVADRAILIRR